MRIASQFQSDVSRASKQNSNLPEKKTANIDGAQLVDNSGKLSLFQDSGVDRKESGMTRISPEKSSQIEAALLGEANDTLKTKNEQKNQVQNIGFSGAQLDGKGIVATFSEIDSAFHAKVSEWADKIIKFPLKWFKSE